MEKVDLRPKVLEIIKQKGPVIPRDVVREIGGDTFIIGAVLSQLRDDKMIEISNTKIGGSPTYYVKGQEEKLQYLSKHLNEKDQKAYVLIKENKVVRDKIQTPLMRVALRSIKDFAKPLEVNIKGEKEIFWKWYMFPNYDVSSIVRKMIGVKEIKAQAKKEEISKEKDKKEETQSSKVSSADRPKNERILKTTDDSEIFHDKINKFFEKNNIEIIEENVLKKKKEYEFVVSMSTPVGKARYYARAKQKKKINEGDLSTAYVKSQSKKIPLLFLTEGGLTKKAKEMVDSGDLENATFKTI
ncbi:hypothetical protein GOV08_02295 [Candidatus Woesearchaeota archaeon]|nr:hypothetical protein [Candidatus Woesearchaeota archaeon]